MPSSNLNQQILEAIGHRDGGGRHGYGITTADRYVSQVLSCVDDGACPAKLRDPVQAYLKDAQSRLVYANDRMSVLKASDEKLSKGSILDFSAVITSKRKDRDQDVLETKGADPDLKMPLLWQHIGPMPIGKLVKILSHTSARLTGRFAIADLPMGHDAATLIEFGALRISHGFRPIRAEPIKDDSDDDGSFMGRGIRFMEFEIMETSVVSVPANTDAVITAFSREKLTDPLVKGWAGKLYKGRPAIIPVGIDLAVKDAPAKVPATQRAGQCSDGAHYPVSPGATPGRATCDDPNQHDKTVPSNPSGGSGEGAEGTWNKPTLSDFTSESWGDLSNGEKNRIARHFAFSPMLPPETFSDLKLPHHFPASGKASLNGVRNALARLSQTQGIPESDRSRVESHLRAHLPRNESALPVSYFKLIELAGEICAVLPDENTAPILRRVAAALGEVVELYEREREDAEWSAAAAELELVTSPKEGSQ